MNFLSFIMINMSYFALCCLHQAASFLLCLPTLKAKYSFCGRLVITFMISEDFITTVQGPSFGTLHFKISLAIYVVSVL